MRTGRMNHMVNWKLHRLAKRTIGRRPEFQNGFRITDAMRIEDPQDPGKFYWRVYVVTKIGEFWASFNAARVRKVTFQ